MTTLCGAWRNAKGFTRRSLHPENSTPNPQKGGYPAPSRVTSLPGANRDFSNWQRQATGGCDRPELLVYFVMSASSAILNALLRHDVIARRAGTLPLCLTALRFPHF